MWQSDKEDVENVVQSDGFVESVTSNMNQKYNKSMDASKLGFTSFLHPTVSCQNVCSLLYYVDLNVQGLEELRIGVLVSEIKHVHTQISCGC